MKRDVKKSGNPQAFSTDPEASGIKFKRRPQPAPRPNLSQWARSRNA